MANLFESLGYEVELTKATRDGGADLICLKRLEGAYSDDHVQNTSNEVKK